MTQGHLEPTEAAGRGFFGRAGPWLIGPEDERWDAAMLVEQASRQAFLAFASDTAYLDGIGHRTAALEDSRLPPPERAEGSCDPRSGAGWP